MATEKRLIDAHDLWSDIMMLPHNGDIISSEEVEQAIKESRTVDAVEVVRCHSMKIKRSILNPWVRHYSGFLFLIGCRKKTIFWWLKLMELLVKRLCRKEISTGRKIAWTGNIVNRLRMMSPTGCHFQNHRRRNENG